MVKRLVISRNNENQVGGSTATSRVSQAGQSKTEGTRRRAMFRVKKLQCTFLRCRKERHWYRLEAKSKWCSRWFMIIQQQAWSERVSTAAVFGCGKEMGKLSHHYFPGIVSSPKTQTNRRCLLWRQNRNRMTLNQRKDTVTTSVRTLEKVLGKRRWPEWDHAMNNTSLSIFIPGTEYVYCAVRTELQINSG